jgi:hypothetical protein
VVSRIWTIELARNLGDAQRLLEEVWRRLREFEATGPRDSQSTLALGEHLTDLKALVAKMDVVHEVARERDEIRKDS